MHGRFRSVLLAVLPVAAIVLATVLAYEPALFNFFAGDDFVHLTWLPDAIRNPELIWRNFHSAWLDGTTARFYRPLISVFMVGDYLIWGANGLGFHLTNLAAHLASALFLLLIVFEIAGHLNDRESKIGARAWPFIAAALFALYPLHPEAVSWITGRVDAIVTAFTLATLWYYIRWRSTDQVLWFAAAALSMSLALLSKEMAITLPALFVAWEVLLGRKAAGEGKRWSPRGLWATFPFWVLLAAYFVVRRIALGTFVGGYDNSLLFVANPRLFVSGWIHGLTMMLVPINKELVGAHHPLTKLWLACLAGSLVLTAWALFRNRNAFAPFLFLLSWIAFSLAPVYKLFSIADDLEGSRLAYLATAPLCALITFGTAFASRKPLGSPLAATTWLVTAAFLACAWALLWTNNQAWLRAGNESNAIRRALFDLYQSLPGDPPVLVIGLPDNMQGAYVCRNAIVGMTHQPQLPRTINNCFTVGGFEPLLPFGYLKSSLLASADKVRIFRWISESRRFEQIDIRADKGASALWTGKELAAVLCPRPAAQVSFNARADGSLEVRGGPGPAGRPGLIITLPGRSCWSSEFVCVTADLLAPEGQGSAVGADLLYSNDLVKDLALRHRVHASIEPGEGERRLVFSLRAIPEYALGGALRQLELLLPERCHLLVKSVELVDPATIMPAIAFPGSGYLGSKGFLHLSAHEPSASVTVDAAGIAGAASVDLELTRANLTFETQNTSETSRVVMKHLRCDTASGTILLERSDFPERGLYEARPRALDSSGKPVGVAGDHIIISVDS